MNHGQIVVAGRQLDPRPRHAVEVLLAVHAAVDRRRHVHRRAEPAGEVVVQQGGRRERRAGVRAVHAHLEDGQLFQGQITGMGSAGARPALEIPGITGNPVDNGARARAPDLGAQGHVRSVEIDGAECPLGRLVRRGIAGPRCPGHLDALFLRAAGRCEPGDVARRRQGSADGRDIQHGRECDISDHWRASSRDSRRSSSSSQRSMAASSSALVSSRA